MNTDKRRYKNKFQISDFNCVSSPSASAGLTRQPALTLGLLTSALKKISALICVYAVAGWFISLCLFVFPLKNKAQVRPVYDYGAIGLSQLLKRLNNTKSVMHIGAHPDDEDSGLLAYLARGENARTAYLSLTRGDGGQNILGTELSESLGVIRTEELLQARRLDGAEQFFTRAYDYGFSKTLDEAKNPIFNFPNVIVVADMGKGKYVYCSYAFFRQLPAGVRGAYRIFANLLSLK